jgi:hypothetical protein
MTLIDWLRKNLPEQPRLVLKYNGCVTNDPCAICGEQTHSIEGPELFLEDTRQLICDICGERYAPELLRLKDIYARARAEAEEEGRRLQAKGKPVDLDALTLGALERLSRRDYTVLQEAIQHHLRNVSDEDLSDLHRQWRKLESEDPEVSQKIRLFEQELVRRGRLDVLVRDGVYGLREEDPEARVIAAWRELVAQEE